MKRLFCSLIVFGFCGSAFGARFLTHNIQNCDFWTSSYGPSGGYICSTWPQHLRVPDAHSLGTQIDALEKRILELEQRLEQIESQEASKRQ